MFILGDIFFKVELPFKGILCLDPQHFENKIRNATTPKQKWEVNSKLAF